MSYLKRKGRRGVGGASYFHTPFADVRQSDTYISDDQSFNCLEDVTCFYLSSFYTDLNNVIKRCQKCTQAHLPK